VLKSRSAILRVLCVAVALAIAIPLLRPSTASAAGITLTPTSGPVAQVVTVNGSGYGNGETVTISFNGSPVATTPAIVTTSGTGTFSASFNVPAVPPGFYNVSAHGNTSLATFNATFQVVTTATTTMSLQKSVSDNGGPFGTNINANPGDVLTYALQYTNTGGNTATGVTIVDQLAAGQTFQAAGTSAGCVATVSGGVTTVTCTVGSPVPPTGPSSSGIFFINTTVNFAFTGTIPNTGQIYANNATTSNSNTTYVNGSVTGSVTLAKRVAVNGGAFATTGTAGPGDQLTYAITYTNNTGATVTNVMISDVLAAGQTIFAASVGCSYNSSTRTATCGPYSVASATSITIQLGTQINAGFTGQITNQASANFNATTVTSNTTVINPHTTPGGALTLCGLVSGYVPSTSVSNGSITISGVTVTIAAGATINGAPIFNGANMCVGFNLTSSNQAVTVTGSANVPGVGLACGVYQPSGTAGYILVGGFPIALGSGVVIAPFITPGALYCFLVSPSGQIYGVLSGIPTSTATEVAPVKVGRMVME
jgi:uncharacterized repeat protein (TIGR01451 family)